MGKRIERLEQALTAWEDECFLNAKLGKYLSDEKKYLLGVADRTGPYFHHSELRQHIIENGAKGDYDFGRFSFSEVVKSSLLETGTVPMHLFAWNHYSRRVFRLDHNLQTLLSATSLEGIYLREIKWPFDSFVLELADPIFDKEGRPFDCIIVSEIGKISKHPGSLKCKMYDFLILSAELDRYRPLDRKKIGKAFGRNTENLEKMNQKWNHIGLNFMKSFFMFIYYEPELDEPVNRPMGESFKEYFETFDRARGQFYSSVGIETKNEDVDDYLALSIYDKVKHLVASTCLFLSTLPPKKTVESNRTGESADRISDSSVACVTDAEEIFHIPCESVLSKETQETVAEITRSRNCHEVRPHFRRGHWRRIWGSKENLDAPKIWIRPCLVNKEKLPQNSIPLASQSNLQ